MSHPAGPPAGNVDSGAVSRNHSATQEEQLEKESLQAPVGCFGQVSVVE